MINHQRRYWNDERYKYPVNSVENAVLFQFVEDRKIGEPQYIVSQEKIHSRLSYPPRILSKDRIELILNFMNDTSAYYRGYIDGILDFNKYAGVIFFDKDNEVVGHLTFCPDHIEVFPFTPITGFSPTGVLTKESQVKLKNLITEWLAKKK